MSETLITELILAVIGLLAFALLVVIVVFAPKLKALIAAKVATGKNEIVWYWAQVAYSFAEKKGKDFENLSGSDKAKIAYEWLSQKLSTLNIHVSADQIKDVIQLAWHKLEEVPRKQGSTTVVNTELTDSSELVGRKVQEHMQNEVSKVLDTKDNS